MIESLSSKNLPAPRFRYSPLVKSGPFYKTAGMIALNKETDQLEPGGAGAGDRQDPQQPAGSPA